MKALFWKPEHSRFTLGAVPVSRPQVYLEVMSKAVLLLSCAFYGMVCMINLRYFILDQIPNESNNQAS